MPCRLDSAPSVLYGRGLYGILGVVPSPREVIAVFPELSPTVQPHAQEVRFHRGDSFDIDVQVQNDVDPPSSVSIANSVLRFAARIGHGYVPPNLISVGNEGAQIIKRSYNPSEIEVVDETNGKATIHIKKTDTYDHPLTKMVWDLEVTRGVEHISGMTGTVKVLQGDAIIMGNALVNFPEDLQMGDIIHVQGRYVLILQRIDNRTLKTDFTGWTSEQGLTYNLYRGQSTTVASGHWTCLGDAIR